MTENSVKITVFTPTYNRAYLLKNLYESLCRQQFRDFEWLIVDDGSQDETQAIVEQWEKEANFSIRYFKKQNGGKHTAINVGLEKAVGELFFTVDSDDYLTDDALERIAYWESTIAGKSGYAGVVGRKRCVREDGEQVPKEAALGIEGIGLEGEYQDAFFYERKSIGITGEMSEVYYTEIYKKHPFPVFAGEKFMTEAVPQNEIAMEGMQIRWVNEFWQCCEYRPDGLTAQGLELFHKNPKGYYYWLRQERKIQKKPRWQMNLNFYAELHERLKFSGLCSVMGAAALEGAVLYGLHRLLKRVKKSG